jgi:hypothetical protein
MIKIVNNLFKSIHTNYRTFGKQNIFYSFTKETSSKLIKKKIINVKEEKIN